MLLGKDHRPNRFQGVATVKLRFALQLDRGRKGAVTRGGGGVGVGYPARDSLQACADPPVLST
jgi:hypothetical protein